MKLYCQYSIKLLLFISVYMLLNLPAFAELKLNENERQWIKDNPVVKFTGDPNWLPYEAFEKDGSYVGIVSEHLKLITKLTGLKFISVPVSSWTESLKIAIAGQVSIISGDTADVNLNKNFKPVDSYSNNPIIIVMDIYQDHVEQLHDIKDKKIAIIKDYGYTADLYKNYPDISFIEVENIHEGLEGVASHRFDAMLASIALATYHMSEMGLNNIRVVGKTNVVMNLTLFIDKKEPRLHSIINKALNSISLSDSNEISQAWIKHNHIEKVDYTLVYQIIFTSLAIVFFFIIWNLRLAKEIKLRLEVEKKNLNNEKVVSTQVKIINQTHDSIISTDMEGVIVFWNKGSEILLGYNSKEMLGQHISVIHQEHDQKTLEQTIIPLLIESGSKDYETKLSPKIGDAFYCHISLSIIFDEQGKPTDIIVVSSDIDEKKNAEFALIQSERLLEKAQAISKIGHWKLNPNTGEVDASDELLRIFAFSSNEASLEKFIEVVHPDDREMEREAIQCGVKHGESWDIEHRLICSDGKEKWVHAVGEAIKDKNECVIELLGTIQDITNEKLLDLELELSNLRFKSMFESIPDAIIYADPERRIHMVNQAAVELFGFNEKELIGNETKMLYSSKNDFQQQGIERFNPTSKIKQSRKIINYKCKNGNEFPGETIGAVVKASNGKVLGYLGIIRDVAERILLEAEIENHQNSLEHQIELRTSELVLARDEAEHANHAKSEFLSRMSHELRTPLNAILGFGQLLELNDEQLNLVQKANVKEILEAGNHLLNLINQVLDLSKIEAGKMEVSIEKVDVTQLIGESIKLISNALDSKNINLIDNISSCHYFVDADPLHLKQILVNLLSNAVKYNQPSGQIILDGRVNSKRLSICITDTGKGLTKDEISRLFSPFERLNVEENIEGTGIGLTISKHLSEIMDGSIGVESSLGRGSTFWIELKLSQELETTR